MDKDTFFAKKQLINCRGKYIDLSTPKIMGILNVTPDSFFDGGKFINEQQIRNRIEQMIREGADIIDVGAYSSRPGAKNISTEEEWSRLSKALEILRSISSEILVSVDTFRSEIARKTVESFKVDMINDISAGNEDPQMFETIADLKIAYIIMHMQGNPQTMQILPTYADIMREIVEFLGAKTEQLKRLGVIDIIIDPGFGFGKTLEHNYQVIDHIDALKVIGVPVLAGISRKSMIYRHLNTSPDGALTGTIVLNTLLLERGVNILRVHDIKETVETVALFNKTKAEGKNYLQHFQE
jgi:dihydropteroate synthase